MRFLISAFLMTFTVNSYAQANGTFWEWQNFVSIWRLETRIISLEETAIENTDAPSVVAGTDTQQWGPNIAAHSETNHIDSLTNTSTIAGGGYTNREQLIGSAELDPGYVAGSASIATISGGYDNVNNQQAGTIAGGAHHFLYGAGDHGTIGGGSSNSITYGSYSTIGGGGGFSTPHSISGTRATIAGGGGNTIDGHYNVISGGLNNAVYAHSSAIAGGRDNAIYAEYSLVAGNQSTILSHALGSMAIGNEVVSSSPGSINVSGRGNEGQSIVFNLNNQTINSETVYLLGKGVWTTPNIPENAIWSGEIHVTAASDSGLVSAYKVSFASTSSRVVAMSVTEDFADELGIGIPSLIIQNYRFLFNVTGVSGQTINWNATAVVSQANL
jgi:hypothetical protein